jgi:hypothetical protein
MSQAAFRPGVPAFDAVRICRGLNLAALVVACGMLSLRTPNLLLTCTAAALPVLALAACLGTAETTYSGVAGTGARPAANFALWLPAGTLAVRDLWSGPLLLHPLDFLWVGFAGGLLMMTFMLMGDPNARYSTPRSMTLAFMAFLYAAGLVPLLDKLADRSAPSGMFYAPIAGRHIEQGLRQHYYVSLKPWGPMLHDTIVEVPQMVYRRAQAGGQLCTTLHPGALGMEWYTVSLCE